MRDNDAVRILVISDIHGYIDSVHALGQHLSDERYDILVVCGDLTHFGSISELREIISALRCEVRCELLIIVLGNCDPREALSSSMKGVSAHILHGDIIVWHDFAIGGVSGGIISPFMTPIEFSEDELMMALNNIGEKWHNYANRILVTHVPPYKTKVDIAHSGIHIGSSSLRKFIIEESPMVCFCGHVHEARGMDKLDNTLIINPGPLRKGYYADVIIRRREKRIKVSFKEVL
ncbi:MAG: YfcE family phosphodiesterase [Thermoprotei archaeon]|nr:MAG: YfcE family phosphodiesterase [Thermoprotei archaeon]